MARVTYPWDLYHLIVMLMRETGDRIAKQKTHDVWKPVAGNIYYTLDGVRKYVKAAITHIQGPRLCEGPTPLTVECRLLAQTVETDVIANAENVMFVPDNVNAEFVLDKKIVDSHTESVAVDTLTFSVYVK